MKDEWVKTTMGEIGKVCMCKRIFKEETAANGDIPFYKIGTFGKDADAFIPVHIYNEYRSKYPFPKKGDVLISASGTIGRRVRYDGEPAYFQDSNIVWIENDETQVLNDYLYHFYDACEWKSTKGATISRLYNDDLKRIVIAFPKSPEKQKRVVAILDKAFDGIATAKANAERNLRNARELFESYLQSVFTQRGAGWKQRTLKEIATTFGRGKSRHRPRNEAKLYGGKYPFIQTGDIRNAGHFITEYSQTYSEAGLAQSKLWPKGTICITIAANIAETGILGFDACFPDSVIGVVVDPDETDVDYVEYLLQSFKARIQALGKGSAQANINMGTFENERFPFPSVAVQKEIVAKLDLLIEETQRLESIYQQKITVLDELKKSLLHKAFSGAL